MRASFSPITISDERVIASRESEVGAPVTSIFVTVKTGDQAKR